MYSQAYNLITSAGMPFTPLSAPSAMSVQSSFQSFTLPPNQLFAPSGGQQLLCPQAQVNFPGGLGELPAAFNSNSTLAASVSGSTLVDIEESPMDVDPSNGDLLAPDFMKKASLYYDATDSLMDGLEQLAVSQPTVYMDCSPDAPTHRYPRRRSARAVFSSCGSLVKADSMCVDGSKDRQRMLPSARYNPYAGRSRDTKKTSVRSTFTKDQQKLLAEVSCTPKETKKAAVFVSQTYGTDLLRATVLCTPTAPPRPIAVVPQPTSQSQGGLFDIAHKVASGVEKAIKTVKVRGLLWLAQVPRVVGNPPPALRVLSGPCVIRQVISPTNL
ncbi:hypothetical protein K474DRAFT_1701865 [Panus rudis PR-1116 ss-1]|nr:hypothetical protein K474DRAFT_1701865 [Panus rudis PR-1116 ss-1]